VSEGIGTPILTFDQDLKETLEGFVDPYLSTGGGLELVESQLAALASSSAHAWLTPLIILSLPGIVAAPLFSMKEACS
jgi:hypothetical protein